VLLVATNPLTMLMTSSFDASNGPLVATVGQLLLVETRTLSEEASAFFRILFAHCVQLLSD